MLRRILAGAFAVLTFALAHPVFAAQLPRLIDQNGQPFTFADLRGAPIIVTFISAHCTDACPLVNAQFGQAAQDMARRHIHARLLTITLDPEKDSLSDMRTIARRFQADRRVWIVAGGSRRDVHAVMAAFGVVARRGRKGYAEVHSTFVYLIDSQGALKKTMLASTALTDQILDNVR
jgi:protein SCO1/2